MSARQGKRTAIGFEEIVGSSTAAAGLLDVQTVGAGPAGSLPLTPGDAPRRPERRSLRVDPERGHGMGPAGARTPAVPDPLDARGHPRAGRPADRPGLSHGPLGGRAPDAGGRRGAPRPRVPPVRRLRHRPLRRPDPGDGRDDGQPPLPERRRAGLPAAHPLAAHAAGRPRRRHLRQGPAGDDDGPRGDAESAVRPGAGRRDPARPRRGGRRHGAVHRRALRARRDHASSAPRTWAAAPAARPAEAASSWAPPRPPRSWAKRSASPCPTRPWRRRASRSGSTWRGAPPARWSRSRREASRPATSSPTRPCGTP